MARPGYWSNPWLKGQAFDFGWAPISSPVLDQSVADFVTHIWFSHEHPDHFSPPSLNGLSEQTKRNATVLYQKTRDGRVVEFCRKVGFKTRELEYGERVSLGDRFWIACFSRNDGDSWMVANVDGKTIVNLNDCVLNTPGRLKVLRSVVGKADVLLTQFGYAMWVGNRDERHLRRAAVDQKLRAIQLQTRALQVKSVIPFASFIYFCHDENRFMNDGLAPLAEVMRAIEDVGARPVLLYPGDRWTVGETWDNSEPLRRYAQDYSAVEKRQALTSPRIEWERLIESAKSLVADVEKRNSVQFLKALYAINFLKVLRFWISDLHVACTLSLCTGLSPAPGLGREDCDIEVGSSALDYALKLPWGMGTLMVNARFQTISRSAVGRLANVCAVRELNSAGFSLPRDLPTIMSHRVRDEVGFREVARRARQRLSA